jgi:ankyrin repeat protein
MGGTPAEEALMSSSWDAYKQTMVEPETLWSAARRNDLVGLGRLIGAGAEINARDHRGYSPLMLAVYLGNAEAAERLLLAGADPNSVDLAGSSVLMGAAFKGHLELCEKLLAAGADPTIRNHAGLDARGFAVSFGRVDVAALLDERAAGQPITSRI